MHHKFLHTEVKSKQHIHFKRYIQIKISFVEYLHRHSVQIMMDTAHFNQSSKVSDGDVTK